MEFLAVINMHMFWFIGISLLTIDSFPVLTSSWFLLMRQPVYLVHEASLCHPTKQAGWSLPVYFPWYESAQWDRITAEAAIIRQLCNHWLREFVNVLVSVFVLCYESLFFLIFVLTWPSQGVCLKVTIVITWDWSFQEHSRLFCRYQGFQSQTHSSGVCKAFVCLLLKIWSVISGSSSQFLLYVHNSCW